MERAGGKSIVLLESSSEVRTSIRLEMQEPRSRQVFNRLSAIVEAFHKGKLSRSWYIASLTLHTIN
jgi:hypothetical protein